MRLKVDKVFCLHHTPLIARHSRLTEFFKKTNLEVDWVTGYLPETITINECHQIMNQMITKKIIELPNTSMADNIDFAKMKSKNLVSLYKKQVFCIQEQVKNNYQYILILEDDVDTTDPMFNEVYLNSCIDEFKNADGDLLFIGTCCDLHSRNRSTYSHIRPEQTSRCAHMYVVKLDAAKTMLQHLPNISDAYDWKLNEIIKNESLKVWWVEPGIEQYGYVSSLVGEVTGKEKNMEKK